MAFTYSKSWANGNRDKVRFLIGDTDEDRQLFDDDEITAALSLKNSDLIRTAIFMLEGLESRYTRLSEARAGDIIADMNDVATKIRRRLKELKQKGVKGFAYIYTADRDTDDSDTGIMHPEISLGEFDNKD